MRAGRASRTAVLVCMGRAAAHGMAAVPRFADPTALALLPDEARAQVERYRAGPPRRLRERFAYAYLDRQGKMMAARTMAIDDALREAAAPQVVILGAGLDGRAWRMPQLRDAVVFEVDHPDSQRDKRAGIEQLAQTAGEVRFVAVDFAHDDLDDALRAAGHDPACATTWIWEGVVMYLERRDIDATLSVIARRSPAHSRLVIAYHQPALFLKVLGLYLRAVGEPLRSQLSPSDMRALLARHGFDVVSDRDLVEAAAAMGADLERELRLLRHLRIVVADCAAGANGARRS